MYMLIYFKKQILHLLIPRLCRTFLILGSSLGILSPIGCMLSGTLMDVFGRKLYFFVMFIPQVVSWTVIALASSYEMLLCGMAIQGFGLGMNKIII